MSLQVHIQIERETLLPDELMQLYATEGWINPQTITQQAIRSMIDCCTCCVTARAADGQLVGFTKVLSDGLFYTTVAEIIVHPNHRRVGIGRKMMEEVRNNYGTTPIFLEAMKSSREFAESCGFVHRPAMAVMSKWFIKEHSSPS